MESQLSPITAARIFRYDLATYHLLAENGMIPRNTELIYGVIIYKMTISPLHAKVVTKLGHILNRLFSEQFIVRQEKPISIQNSEPEPDISVVRGSYDDFGENHPQTAELVVEIAYSSIEEELHKAAIYASFGVPDYWILDLKEKKFHVLQSPNQGKYSVHTIYESFIAIPIPHSNETISLDRLL